MSTTHHHRIVPSPLGELRLVANADALVWLGFTDHPWPVPDWRSAPADRHPVLDLAARELARYFGARLKTFSTPLAPEGTALQKQVWEALSEIPYGETRSYSDIARAVGRPRAFRAVGAANGRNPLALIVPCHRVIGASGALTGYGGGLPRKQWLLEHERRMAE